MLVPEQQISTPFRFRWMFRLLDVPSALAARGYPPIDADVVVAVDDPAFPENAGPWRLTVRGGDATVEPAPDARVEAMPIGILSTLFSGFLTAAGRGPSGLSAPRRPRRARAAAAPGRLRPLVPVLLLARRGRATMTVTVRAARADDWSAVASLLVELGRGVAAGTAEDPTHRMQFGGHLRRLDSVTLVRRDGR